MSKNILFFIPYNQQVVYIESIAEQFRQNKDNIYLVTYDDWGPTHENFSKFQASITCLPRIKLRIPFLYHLMRIFQLAMFCYRNKIDIVYSHYQEANLIAVLAQYFTKAKFIITRHHSDCATVDHNFKESVGDKIINRLSRIYIAPSRLVFDQIVSIEGTRPQKVTLINYGYNFENFGTVNLEVVSVLKRQFSSQLLLVMAARFIPEKRHELLIDVVARLVSEGLDIKVLLLSKGPMFDEIADLIRRRNLEENIYLLGYKYNVLDYFAVADLVVHLSVSEASNSAIKEAALTETPVAVCENVGDFSDYIIHEKNGFLLDKESPAQELEALVRRLYNDKEQSKSIGKKLKQDVLNRFDIMNVMPAYHKLHENLFNGKN